MASIVEEFDSLHAKAKATRTQFYTALFEWDSGLDSEGLPPQAQLITEARTSQGTFYRMTDETYRTVQTHLPPPPTPNRVRRIVQEAKELTAQPWMVGWREQVSRMRLRPQLQAETLVQVCCRWALRYPNLVVMDQMALPLEITRSARRCFTTRDGEMAPDLGPFLDAIRQAMIFAMQAPHLRAASGLDHVRAQLADIEFDDQDLEQKLIEAYHMVAEYMLLAQGRFHESSPALVDLLERATDELRAIQGNPNLSETDTTA